MNGRSVFSLRIPELKKFIVSYWKGKVDAGQEPFSVLVLGPPGIGKSEVMREIAKEMAKHLGKEYIEVKITREKEKYENTVREILRNPDKYFVFVDLRLTEIEPVDLMGIPQTQYADTEIDKSVKKMMGVDYIPMFWALCLAFCPGLLFLDEITNVQRLDVQAAAYKVVLERMAGFVKFHPKSIVIAAGNRPEQSGIAQELPAPLVNRFLVINSAPPTVEEWREYMERRFGDAWDYVTYAYLSLNKNKLLATNIPATTLENYPTPRSWTQLAVVLFQLKKIYSVGSEEYMRALLTYSAGLLGTIVGGEFFCIYKLLAIEVLPKPQEVLENPVLIKDKVKDYETSEVVGDKEIKVKISAEEIAHYIILYLAEYISAHPELYEKYHENLKKIYEILSSMSSLIHQKAIANFFSYKVFGETAVEVALKTKSDIAIEDIMREIMKILDELEERIWKIMEDWKKKYGK